MISRRRRTNSTTEDAVTPSAASREFTSVNNTLKALMGGTQRSWMRNENAVPVRGGDSVPATIRPQTGPLKLRKTPRNRPASQALSGSVDGNVLIATVGPEGSVNWAEVGQGESLGQSSESTTRKPVGVDTESMLPSPAPSKSPPGPEHRELERTMSASHSAVPYARTPSVTPGDQPTQEPVTSGTPTLSEADREGTGQVTDTPHAGQKRCGGSLEAGDIRQPKRVVTAPLVSPPAPSPPSDQQHLLRRSSSHSTLIDTASSSRTVYTPRPSPAPSPSQITFPGNATIPRQLPNLLPGTSHQSQNTKDSNVKTLLATLEAFKVSSDRRDAPISPLENLRITLLMTAVKDDDIIFLLIHQVFCAQTLSAENINQQAGITTEHTEGLNLLKSFLYDNAKISLRCLQFFAGFPWKYGAPEMRHPNVTSAMKLIRQFLNQDYEMVARVRRVCAKRSYKLTDEDMKKNMGCLSSPGLTAVFAISIRNMVEKSIQSNKSAPIPNASNVPNVAHAQRPIQGQGVIGTENGYFNFNNMRVSPPETPSIPQQTESGGYFHSLPPPPTHMVAQPTPPFPNQMVSSIAVNQQQRQQHQNRLHQLQHIQQQHQQFPHQHHQQLQQPQPQQPLQPQPQQPLQPQPNPNMQQIMHNSFVSSVRYSSGIMGQQQFPANNHGQQPWHGQTYPPNIQHMQGAPLVSPRIHHQAQSLVGGQLRPNIVPSNAPGSVPLPPSLHPSLILPPVPDNLLETHLASPVMSQASSPIDSSPLDKLHFSIVDFPVQRIKLPFACEVEKRTWTISAEDERRLSRLNPPKTLGEPPARPMVSCGTLVYRLRCVEVKQGEIPPMADAEWAAKDSVWPKNIFIEINGKRLEFRRKSRWGKDLPVDITNFVQAGLNDIKVMRLNNNSDLSSYYACIEVFECRKESTIKATMTTIDEQQSREAIVRRLSSNDDVDLIVSSSTVIVGVCCPLSFRLIDMPVRGKACVHLECFDFDNYMSSRPREAPGVPPKEDSYKCPHCGVRARPEDLVVDGYLNDVLVKIREDIPKYKDVKHIIIDDKGDWEAKQPNESEEGCRRQGPGGKHERRESTVSIVGKLKREVEIICIDDD
ncbi:hypothetical protein K440DRAFT_636793 [Wilcoxina mikolae CBS 423.85]|nr:hypothetical protein K440DRAFT_636793 [Wilcoxina mikolae CBS 423.85]